MHSAASHDRADWLGSEQALLLLPKDTDAAGTALSTSATAFFPGIFLGGGVAAVGSRNLVLRL